MKGKNMTTATKTVAVKNTKVSPKVLERLALAYVKAETKVDGSEVDAAHKAYAFVLAGGKASVLTDAHGIAKGTVSKRVALGKALSVVGEVDAETVTAIKQTLTGNRGDRAKLVKASADGSSAGVVAATKARKPASKSKGSKSKGAATVTLKDMTPEALVSLMGDALAELANRGDDAAIAGVSLTKVAKSATVIAKNLMAMPVA